MVSVILLLPIPAGIAAWRGIKWGVATISAIGMIGLGAASALLVLQVLLTPLESDAIWYKLALLAVAAFPLWVGWRHVGFVLPYLRSGDRGHLFCEYRRSGTDSSFGIWHNFKTAPRNKRAKALAWILVAVPVGAVLYLGLVQTLLMATDLMPGIATPLFGTFVLIDLLDTLAFFGALGAIYFLFRHGLRHIAPSATAIRHEDQRSPIVLLRSFADENITVPRSLERQIVFGLFERIPKRLDEVLEQDLRSHGPVIAIGRPREALPSLGAAKEYASDAEWMSLVERWLREAGVVVAILGDTEGFVWEMSTILRLSVRQKLILVVPPMRAAHQNRERWKKISKALDVEFELPAGALTVSWDDGNTNVVTAGRLYRDAQAYRMALDWVLNARRQIASS